MDKIKALSALSALAQETRLDALRLLVQQGSQGMSAGELTQHLGVPQNTLSFHLSHLSQGGLITSEKRGRHIFYFAHFKNIQRLVGFLLKDCCAADRSTCSDIDHLLKKACCA